MANRMQNYDHITIVAHRGLLINCAGSSGLPPI